MTTFDDAAPVAKPDSEIDNLLSDDEISKKVKSLTVDDTTVQFHNAKDQIELERNEERKKKKSPFSFIRRRKLRPPGA